MKRKVKRMKGTDRAHMPTILTLEEVAKFLRCSKAQTCNLTNGKVRGVPILPTVGFGKRKVVRQQTLVAWMEARESEARKKVIDTLPAA
jgi:hypothetical protein